jgi:hypothetical protein
MWCGGGHLHKKCPEKGNSSSTPSCCKCKLMEDEKPHLSNYMAVDNNPPERIRPFDLQKLINSLKLRKACGIDDIPNECFR